MKLQIVIEHFQALSCHGTDVAHMTGKFANPGDLKTYKPYR